MNEQRLLDEIFYFVLKGMVDTGQAPHYTEIAAHFNKSTEEGRTLLHTLLSQGLPAWVHPGTDIIASFAPFNNLPTHYRITIDGRQKWFGQ